ncbi:alpha/beta hydrolase [Segetibacter sp. 3557_3]|uniref:alpha/beta hydrolase n=1 Tax=Segetibacter sp. 3557_3 TaxID=2547429 RepID=UPI0010584ED9|nr:alpha/beta hydrolase-fold protein [Segetibacter sp. 3557_3]TDH29063.1 alpha/beta hydrolase [Segetibacter sp. 3557_3]
MQLQSGAAFTTTKLVRWSGSVNDSFDIYVSVPPSYDSGQKYSVVYYLDANLPSGSALQFLLSTKGYDHQFSNVLFVGIGHRYKGNHNVPRKRDFMMPALPGDTRTNRNSHAERFYLFVKNELVPYVNRSYPVINNSSAIIGHSLGGLFVFYCLFKNENLFSHFFAIGPALWVHRYAIYNYDRLADDQTHNKYLFLSAGSKEVFNRILHGANKAKKYFDLRKYPKLKYDYVVVKGKGHHSQVPVTLAIILDRKLSAF